MRMTPRQREVYVFVRQYWKMYGYAPSLQDIAMGLGLNSKGNVHRLVKVLLDKGALVREENKKRTLRGRKDVLENML